MQKRRSINQLITRRFSEVLREIALDAGRKHLQTKKVKRSRATRHYPQQTAGLMKRLLEGGQEKEDLA